MTEMNCAKDQKSPGDMRPATPLLVEPRLPFLEKYFSWRYIMVFLMHTSLVIFISLRNSMSMALVCMTKQPGAEASTVFFNNISKNIDGNVTMTHISDLEFSWSSQVQGLILTSPLFLSPVAPLLPNIIKIFFKVKNKHIMSASNLLAAVVTLLSPMGARISPYFLVALRVILGLTGGVSIPIIGDLIAWWAPQGEKLSMSALSFVGVNVGGALASLFAGFLCSIPVDNGWPFIFYVFGSLTLLWGVAWHFLCTEKPEEHPYISNSERDHILSHRSDVTNDVQNSEKRGGPPWVLIMTSIPVLAFFATISCHFWASNTMITYLPPYVSTILEFNVQQIGVMASIMSLTAIFGTFVWTAVGNLMVQKVSARVTRKVCITTGLTIAAFSYVGVSFCGKNERWVAYGLLLNCMLAQASGTSHLAAVPQDMAPRYAGVINGLFFSIGSIVAITGPLIVSYITANGTQEEWRVAWLVMGSGFFLGALCFGILGKASLLPWARVGRKSIQIVVDRPPEVVTVSPPPEVTDSRTFSKEVQVSAVLERSMKCGGDDKLNGMTSHVKKKNNHKLHSKSLEEAEGFDNNAFYTKENWFDECTGDKTDGNHHRRLVNNEEIEITKL